MGKWKQWKQKSDLIQMIKMKIFNNVNMLLLLRSQINSTIFVWQSFNGVRDVAAFVIVLRNPLNLRASAADDFLSEPFPKSEEECKMLNNSCIHLSRSPLGGLQKWGSCSDLRSGHDVFDRSIRASCCRNWITLFHWRIPRLIPRGLLGENVRCTWASWSSSWSSN